VHSVRASAECRPGCEAMKNKGPLPGVKTEESGPLVGNVRRGWSPLARRPAPRPKLRDLAPAVVIVRWNIVGLATDFHFRTDRKANPQHKDWPLVSTFPYQPSGSRPVA